MHAPVPEKISRVEPGLPVPVPPVPFAENVMLFGDALLSAVIEIPVPGIKLTVSRPLATNCGEPFTYQFLNVEFN